MELVKPPRDHHPIPYLFLNSNLKQKEVEPFSKELKNKHIHSVFLHPVPDYILNTSPINTGRR